MLEEESEQPISEGSEEEGEEFDGKAIHDAAEAKYQAAKAKNPKPE
jgi:hypothetical protein